MRTSLTDTLCTRCGLCCDGSLFADVELAGRVEATRLEVMGLGIEDDGSGGALLSQPCRGLRGKRCDVYAHRPACCRTFECRLLRDVRRGTLGVERARARIAETRKLIARVKRRAARLGRGDGHLPLMESCAEVLGRGTDATPRAHRRRASLEAALAAAEASLRRTFLDGGGPS